MPLQPGVTLGSYEIVAALGAGGMGEVYRARDTSLGRDVAVKVLPDAVAGDADRLARFRREAEALAALNHPNIAQIYGLETSGSTPAIAMELVPGDTLAERVANGPIPLGEALPIARQMVSALEAAHERGIVHRDLKPANVKMTDEGVVKVLDFGLAKVIEPPGAPSTDAANSPTLTARATQMGIALGTAAYMAPEQARGKHVDKRADVWAFGVVLFEMLAGRRPFEGSDATEVMARVIDRDVDWNLLPAATPVALRRLLRRCLTKDRNDRLRDIGDARLEIDDLLAGRDESAARVSASTRRSPLPALGFAAAALMVGAAIWAPWPDAAPAHVTRFDYEVPADQPLRSSSRQVIALSPDGRSLVVNTAAGLMLRRMDDPQGRVIRGSEADLSGPVFSPDGLSIGFFHRGTSQLMRLSVGGELVAPICPAEEPYGMNWEDDGTILFAQSGGIMRVPAGGGRAELVVPASPGERISGPQLLPDGSRVLFASKAADAASSRLVVYSMRTAQRTELGVVGRSARYLPTGHLLYGVDDTLMAVPFDADALRVLGHGVAVARPVDRYYSDWGVMFYAASPGGTLVHLTGDGVYRRQPLSRALVWVDRNGVEEPTATEPGAFFWLDIAPDGERVAVDRLDPSGDRLDPSGDDILVHTLGSPVFDRLTSRARSLMGVWHPDRQRIAYASVNQTGGRDVYIVPADGSSEPTKLAGGEYRLYPSSWTPDGQLIAVRVDREGDRDLVMFRMGASEPEAVVETEHLETRGQVSPDGNWLAYVSGHTGARQVFVRSLTAAGGRTPVSPLGGDNPRWSPDGQAIYYMHAGFLWAVSLTFTPTLAVAAEPERLFSTAGYFDGTSFLQGLSYDVHPVTGRFLMLKELQVQVRREPWRFRVALDWFEELNRLAPPTPSATR